MGNCSPTPIKLEPPTPVRFYSEEAVRDNYEYHLEARSVEAFGEEYLAYSLTDLRRFLQSLPVEQLMALRGRIGIDNFAYMLLGKEREWLAEANARCTSTFGLAVGEIQMDEELFPRKRAMNCYLDPDRRVWLLDPITLKLVHPSAESNIHYVIL